MNAQTDNSVTAVPEIPSDQLEKLVDAIAEHPERFAQMIKLAREQKNINRSGFRRQLNRKFHQKRFSFTVDVINKWEKGVVPVGDGYRRSAFAEKVECFVVFFGWNVEEVIQQLSADREPGADLSPHEQTLFGMIMTMVNSLAPSNKTAAEANMLAMVGVQFNFAALLQAGLLKLTPEKRLEMLAKMLHTATMTPKD